MVWAQLLYFTLLLATFYGIVRFLEPWLVFPGLHCSFPVLLLQEISGKLAHFHWVSFGVSFFLCWLLGLDCGETLPPPPWYNNDLTLIQALPFLLALSGGHFLPRLRLASYGMVCGKINRARADEVMSWANWILRGGWRESGVLLSLSLLHYSGCTGCYADPLSILVISYVQSLQLVYHSSYEILSFKIFTAFFSPAPCFLFWCHFYRSLLHWCCQASTISEGKLFFNWRMKWYC